MSKLLGVSNEMLRVSNLKQPISTFSIVNFIPQEAFEPRRSCITTQQTLDVGLMLA